MIHWAWLISAFSVGWVLGARLCWVYSARKLARAASEHEAATRGTHPFFKLQAWVEKGDHARSFELSRWRHLGWEIRLYESFGPNDGSKTRKFSAGTPRKAADAAVSGVSL